MSRFTNDVDAVGEMLNNTVVQIISSTINVIGTFCLMMYTNVWLTLITVVMVPFMMLAARAVTMRSRRFYKAQQAALGTLNGYIEETVTGQKVVKVFCHEETAQEEFSWLNYDLRDKQIKAQFFGGIMGPVMGNLGQVGYSLTACIGGLLCVLRGFDIGGLTVFVNYSRQFSRPINELSMQMNTIFSALAGAERVFAVMDEAPEAEDAPEAVELEPCRGHVRLNDVTFGYSPDKVVLKHVSLYAKPGQKIAFVGSTGAGKTTITNLINRFYDIDEGKITIDDVDIRDIARESCAGISPWCFRTPISSPARSGRTSGTEDWTPPTRRWSRRQDRQRPFLHHASGKGYDTMIEGDGANLSQGQRQLLNIARAAISKAPILILDEATCSVDTRTEKHIEEGMDRLMTGPYHPCDRPSPLHRPRCRRHHGAGARAKSWRRGSHEAAACHEGKILRAVHRKAGAGVTLTEVMKELRRTAGNARRAMKDITNPAPSEKVRRPPDF